MVNFFDSRKSGVQITAPAMRDELGLSLLDITHYHTVGLCTLIEKKILPPAFALARIGYESMIRGFWFLNCASDNEIDLFLKNDKILNEEKKKIDFKDLVKAVEDDWGKANTITSFQRKSWPTLNSYTHNGKAIILDHWKDRTFEPKFPEEQIDQIIQLAARSDCLCFITLLCNSNRSDDEGSEHRFDVLHGQPP